MSRIRSARVSVLACLLAAPLSTLPLVGLAQTPAEAAIASPPAAGAAEPERAEYWRRRAESARERAAETGRRLQEANAAVARMQRRGHPRGDARLLLRRAQADARAEHEAALRSLEIELPAEARAAGAHTEWLRESS